MDNISIDYSTHAVVLKVLNGKEMANVYIPALPPDELKRDENILIMGHILPLIQGNMDTVVFIRDCQVNIKMKLKKLVKEEMITQEDIDNFFRMFSRSIQSAYIYRDGEPILVAKAEGIDPTMKDYCLAYMIFFTLSVRYLFLGAEDKAVKKALAKMNIINTSLSAMDYAATLTK